MSLSILNSISALTAENALSSTQTNLQKTFTQLSTGLKINSGSDDAAGLSIANGLQANISALTQSSQNASDGIGLLQTADGALSQVTSLLNRAVTLATEASTGGLSTSAVHRSGYGISVDPDRNRQHRHHDQLQRHSDLWWNRDGVHQ
jgi:flagellin